MSRGTSEHRGPTCRERSDMVAGRTLTASSDDRLVCLGPGCLDARRIDSLAGGGEASQEQPDEV